MKTQMYNWRAVPVEGSNPVKWRLEAQRAPLGRGIYWLPLLGQIIWLIDTFMDWSAPREWRSDFWAPGVYDSPEEGFAVAREAEDKFNGRYNRRNIKKREREARIAKTAVY